MASFCYRIRSTQKNKLVKIQILFTVGRGNQFYVDSQYMVLTDAWDNKRQTVKSRFTFTDDFTEQQGRELTKNLSELRSHILGEILGQLAPLLLGEVVGKGKAALDRLPLVVPSVR